MAEAAATTLPTWIPDQNRFNLAAPPLWTQKELYDFDSQLVVVPSRRSPVFLLCRRRLHSAGYGRLVMIDNKNPDVSMMYDHGLVDIAPLKSFPGLWTAQWVERLKTELRSRDIWEAGGPAKFVEAIEEAEADTEIKKRRTMRDEFRHRAGDAWRSLQARRGLRNKRASDGYDRKRLSRGPKTEGV